METIARNSNMPRDEEKILREEDAQEDVDTPSSDLDHEETGEPVSDEPDLEENDLEDEDVDDVEWEIPGDTNTESGRRS